MPVKSSTVCSQHFTASDYYEGYTRKILKDTAVPCLSAFFEETRNTRPSGRLTHTGKHDIFMGATDLVDIDGKIEFIRMRHHVMDIQTPNCKALSFYD